MMFLVCSGFKILNFRSLSATTYFSKKLLKFQKPIKFVQIEQTRKMSNLSREFQNAVEGLKSLKTDPGNEVKLKLYALFKQSTEGTCSTKKPSAFDFVGKAKWEAWSSLGAMSQDEAKNKYVSLVKELCAEDENIEIKAPVSNGKYEGITYTVNEDVTEITFCRPEKRNAITIQMYKDITAALQEAGQNDTAVTIITGQGDYYSSGNDLSNFASASAQGDLSSAAKNGAEMLKGFVAAFIDFPKILVAAVNGPAVGIPVTLLGLCDIVYASEKSTFYTPFSLLGQSPEGCSTYTFPKIMGYSKANEILLFNKKMTAIEAKNAGLVAEVFPHSTFLDDVKKRLAFLPDASKQSMIHSKALCRSIDREILHKVNADECERLVERWQSPDCMEAIMRFFQKKAKL